MTEPEAICDGVNPYGEYQSWHGRTIAIDGASTDGVTDASLVAEVIAEYNSGEMWDGEVAAVVRLTDGRFVSWETFYGPTGDGFSEDAYGGDADLFVAPTYDAIVRWGLTDEGRRNLNIDQLEVQR